jgi:hypothetical protein
VSTLTVSPATEMSNSAEKRVSAVTNPRKLPLRDWVLLPFLGLLTMAAILLVAESIALRMFPDPPVGKGLKLGDCLTDRGDIAGIRAIPNSVCHAGLWESETVEYKFNSCGDRTSEECGQKPANAYRIVLLGTSTALGWSVPQEKTFAAILPGDLSQSVGRKVDVYNESMMFQTPANVLSRFDEVLAAKPDLILWTYPPIQPLDDSGGLPDHGFLTSADDNDPAEIFPMLLKHVERAYSTKSFVRATRDLLAQLQDCRIRFMLRHELNQSQTRYVKSYLDGDEAKFLKTSTYANDPESLKGFERSVAEIAKRSQAAGVPLAVVMLPFRAQIAMIAMGDWPDGYDPYRLDNEARAIVERHGGIYLSILSDYRETANPERAYFPVDGHPNADGHAILAKLLARELTAGSIPALKATAHPTQKSE